MTYLKKGLLATVALVFCVSALANDFWSQLAHHNPDKLEAIRFVINAIQAGSKPGASEELKSFSYQLIRIMSNYDAASEEWAQLLVYFDSVIREHNAYQVDFCLLTGDDEGCKRFFALVRNYFADDANIPGIEQIDFLKKHRNKK